jgi:hypothetical protein
MTAQQGATAALASVAEQVPLVTAKTTAVEKLKKSQSSGNSLSLSKMFPLHLQQQLGILVHGFTHLEELMACCGPCWLSE